MLMDLHAHSSGISTCCRCDFRQGIDEAKAVGLSGFVLTNHYTSSYVVNDDFDGFARRYREEYRAAKKYGDSVGFKVFFGVEVTWEFCDGVHLLIYGAPEAFVSEHPRMVEYSLEKLYRTVHAYGGILIQAHPYRRGDRLQDLRYLDGVEISCHPHLHYGGSFRAEMTGIACENGKILTCGGDYHADVKYRPNCGVFVPDDLADGAALAHYLKTEASLKLRVHEPGGDFEDMIYARKKL